MHVKKFKFEKFIIWEKSMELGEVIDKISTDFPPKEVFNLNSQIRRACDSIALNIAEGSIVQTKPEFRKFLGYSIRSLAEVVTCLHKAKHRNYIEDDQFDKIYLDSFNLMNMMVAFRRNV